GYIYIPGFYRDFSKKKNDDKPFRNVTDDTRKAIEELKEQFVDGMILDLRDDGGGSLTDAVDIAGMFIGSGPIVVVKNGFDEKFLLDNHGRARIYNGPLVVLVNKFSASASEIVAAALQDYGRAVVIGGEHTHGKGSVQRLIDLSGSKSFLSFRKADDFGALKFTTQKFYRVTGGSTQYKGVEPDIVLPSLFTHIKSGERHLDYSLPWDTIASTKISRWSIPLHLAEIKQRSDNRVAKDKDFSLIRKEAEKAVLRSEKSIVTVTLPELRHDRMETQLSEEKVGDLYKLHALSDDDTEKNGVELTKEEKRKNWLQRVNKDPYVREGMNVIADLISLMGDNSVGSN
ncbi:MAG: tail-specific protease, partial [Desulfobacterales bacterium]